MATVAVTTTDESAAGGDDVRAGVADDGGRCDVLLDVAGAVDAGGPVGLVVPAACAGVVVRVDVLVVAEGTCWP